MTLIEELWHTDKAEADISCPSCQSDESLSIRYVRKERASNLGGRRNKSL